MYYRDPLDRAASAQVDEWTRAYLLRRSEWELADLANHGIRNVVTRLPALGAIRPGAVDFRFDFDLMQSKIDAWRRYGFRPPVVVQVDAPGLYRSHTGTDPQVHVRAASRPPPAYAEDLARMCLRIENERRRRGWPEFLYYPVDEPSMRPGAIDFMLATLKALRAAGLRTFVTADPTKPGFLPLRPYVDVWCAPAFLPPPDELPAFRAEHGADLWCYPNDVNGENDHTPVLGARLTYGFGFWRSGFSALVPWIYRADAGNPWNYLDGSTMDFFNRMEDGGRPIPVALWEAYREGWDDYRYVFTLRELVRRAERRGGRAARLARAARRDLAAVWDRVPVRARYRDEDSWTPREADVYRWMAARHIMALQEAGVR
jgi:hypothetical protein